MTGVANIKKLNILFCLFFLLNIALVSAVDISPIITKFEAVNSTVRTTAELEIQSYDTGSNAGILWMRLTLSF